MILQNKVLVPERLRNYGDTLILYRFFFFFLGIQPAKKEADIFYDILFDDTFPGGLTLRGPSSAQRCYRLHWAAMINISHGDRSPSVTNNHRVGSGSSQQVRINSLLLVSLPYSYIPLEK